MDSRLSDLEWDKHSQVTKTFLEMLKRLGEEARCQHLRTTEVGRPYCGNGLKDEGWPTQERKMVCDIYSVELFCLGGERGNKTCIFYGEGREKFSDTRII